MMLKENYQEILIILAYWDDYAAHEDWEEGCCGLPNNILTIEFL